MNLDGEALREAIDEAIAEIDRVEEDMLALMAGLVGPDAAARLVEYAKAQEERSPLLSLMGKGERYPAHPEETSRSEPDKSEPR